MSDALNAAPAAPVTNEVPVVDATAAPAAPVVEKKAPPASSKKKFNLRVDGVDENMELDLSNEEELRKHLQLSRVSQKRMQQFAEYEKGVKGLFETLQKDPIKVLTDPRIGISDEQRKKLAEMIINNELEELQKSPEQREKERLQKQFEDLKKAHETEKQARESAEFQRLQDQQAVQLDTEISGAIEGAGLPKTARTVKYMAEAMMFCLTNNLDLSAKDLAPYIKKHTLTEFKDMISSLPDEEFEEWLGKDQISRIRKRNLQKLKTAAGTANDVKPTGTTEKNKQEKKVEKVDMKKFFSKLGRF